MNPTTFSTSYSTASITLIWATNQGGRKRCSTVAPLRGTKAKREAQRRRKRREREEKRKKGGGREEKRRRARVRGERVRKGEK